MASVPLAAAACARTPPAPPPAPRGRTAVWLGVLGDSLSFGTGARDTADGFAFRVYRAVARERPGSEISNFSIGGSTASDVLRLQTQRLRERRFDLVIVCAGGNDVVRGTAPAAFGLTYRRLLSAVARGAPRTPIVAVGVPDVSLSPLFSDRARAVRALAAADDAAARTAAATARARYVDLFGLSRSLHDPREYLAEDRFHPSDAGHAAIAALVLPQVRAALARRQ